MDNKPQSDFWLQRLVAVVISIALLVSLAASIFGKNGEFREVALVFGSVSAFIFGANIVTKRK